MRGQLIGSEGVGLGSEELEGLAVFADLGQNMHDLINKCTGVRVCRISNVVRNQCNHVQGIDVLLEEGHNGGLVHGLRVLSCLLVKVGKVEELVEEL